MYTEYFHLTGKPFQLNPDPDFYFGSRGHQRAMAFLEYGLHQAEGFIVVTGEVGAGKTLLVRHLVRQLEGSPVVAGQIVSTLLEPDDLLRHVGAAFDVDLAGADKSTILVRLEARFREIRADGKRALLLVDEAQNLTPRAVEELRMLSNFQDGTQALLQSFLIGQPEFRAIVQRPEMRQLRQRVLASYHLGPLEAGETQAYVLHRLRQVGWSDDPVIEETAFEALHRLSQGVPRRINTISDRLLLSAYLDERHTVSQADVETVAAEIAEEIGLPDALSDGIASDWPAAGVGAQSSHDVELADRLAQMEERVALLEAGSQMSQGTMKKLVRIVRNLAAQQTPR